MNLKSIALAGASLLIQASALAQSLPSLSEEAFAYRIGAIGFGTCVATGINDRGQVIGYATKTGGPYSHRRAFVTGPKGLGVILLSLGGSDSYAWGLNTKGQVVGGSDDSTGKFLPFITDADGANIRVLELPGIDQDARGINDAGQVVGGIAFADGSFSGYFTGPDATGVTILGGYRSEAWAINASSQIIGYFAVPGDTARHSFITGPNGTGMVELSLAGGTANSASALNDKGQVTGTITFADGISQQYLTGPDGTDLRLLGTLKDIPGSSSEGNGINNLGNTVGASYSPGKNKGYPIPVTVTDSTGHMLDLNRLVVNLTNGVTLGAPGGGINRYNQIATHGTDGFCYIVCPKKNCVP